MEWKMHLEYFLVVVIHISMMFFHHNFKQKGLICICFLFTEVESESEDDLPAAKQNKTSSKSKQAPVVSKPAAKSNTNIEKDLFGSPESDEDDIFAQVSKSSKPAPGQLLIHVQLYIEKVFCT